MSILGWIGASSSSRLAVLMLAPALLATMLLSQTTQAPPVSRTGISSVAGANAAVGSPAKHEDPSSADIEKQLRRAKNEYAFGNYDEAVARLRGLLYPMVLENDAQVIEARRYLALSYYLLGNLAQVETEFSKLLFLAPDYELDPFAIAPPVIDLFESLRQRLKPELDAIRQRQIDEKLARPSREGVRQIVETRITERSELSTFLPFGVGQFQNDDTELGIFFAATEAVLLAVNVGAYLYGRYGVGNGFSSDDADRVGMLTVAQYGSLALFGAVYSLGVFQARLNFVPTIESAPKITEETLITTPSSGPGVLFQLGF